MAVSLMVVTQKINKVTASENERSADILEICQSIKNDARIQSVIVDVDCDDNRISFGEAGRFGFNDYRLNATGTDALQKLVPVVLDAANSDKGQKWFKQIVIEGFTDTDGSYLYNLNLSLRRSEWVMCTLLDTNLSVANSFSSGQKQQIKQFFLAGGVSFNAAKDSKEASRRVELRLNFYGLDERLTQATMPVFTQSSFEQCQLAR